MSGLANRWGLTQVRSLPTFTSNGKAVAPDADATDVEITGSGALDYLGFPDLDIDSSNNLYLIAGRTEAHDGGGENEGTILMKSADAGQTWSAPSEIVDYDTDSLGGPTLGLTSGGRLITFHTDFADVKGNGIRRPYFRYSDDDGATFTDFTHLTTDLPSPGQLFGPGKAIRHRGVLLKPMYGRATDTGTRGCYIYKSADNGASWTLHGTIMPYGGVSDFEEPYLCEMPNGLLQCVIKSDTLDYSVCSYSLDGGVHWSAVKFVFNSEGKNPVAASPSGTLLTIGRKFPSTDWRTIYSYSADGGKTWSAEAYADERTSMYMYGGIVWHPGIGKFIAAYSTDSNFPNGPAKIVIKYFTET